KSLRSVMDRQDMNLVHAHEPINDAVGSMHGLPKAFFNFRDEAQAFDRVLERGLFRQCLQCLDGAFLFGGSHIRDFTITSLLGLLLPAQRTRHHPRPIAIRRRRRVHLGLGGRYSCPRCPARSSALSTSPETLASLMNS